MVQEKVPCVVLIEDEQEAAYPIIRELGRHGIITFPTVGAQEAVKKLIPGLLETGFQVIVVIMDGDNRTLNRRPEYNEDSIGDIRKILPDVPIIAASASPARNREIVEKGVDCMICSTAPPGAEVSKTEAITITLSYMEPYLLLETPAFSSKDQLVLIET